VYDESELGELVVDWEEDEVAVELTVLRPAGCKFASAEMFQTSPGSSKELGDWGQFATFCEL
jgi:hypothetical protein